MIITDYLCQLSTNKIRFNFYNEVKWNLTQLTTRRVVACCRSAVSAWWLKRGKPCLRHLHVLCTAFPGGLPVCLAFGSFFSFFYPHFSSPFIFPLINQCVRCLVYSIANDCNPKSNFRWHGFQSPVLQIQNLGLFWRRNWPALCFCLITLNSLLSPPSPLPLVSPPSFQG